MQVNSIRSGTTFQGSNPKRGVRNIGQLMNKLYASAYNGKLESDIIQISSKMKDGVEVSGIATFDRGRFINLSFPYEHAHYRSEFCANILKKYNEVVTKGKAYK